MAAAPPATAQPRLTGWRRPESTSTSSAKRAGLIAAPSANGNTVARSAPTWIAYGSDSAAWEMVILGETSSTLRATSEPEWRPRLLKTWRRFLSKTSTFKTFASEAPKGPSQALELNQV